MSLSDAQSSLSGKITRGYYAIAVLIVAAAALTFAELLALESKVLLGERAVDLFDTTLEIRRFERNYFLHREPADYAGNRLALDRTRAFLDRYGAGFAAIESRETLSRLRHLLGEYEQHMTAYAKTPPRSGRALADAESAVRAAGKNIVAIAGELAEVEKTAVRNALASFRLVLVLGIAALAVLIAVMGRAISRRIVGPLKAMEGGVAAVSAGQPGPLKAPTRDREIVSITVAFNHMLHELELRRKHLVRAEKLASMGTMLSGVAHELNNPLSNISTSCQILLEEWREADPAAQQMYLAQIDEQCDRARNIVRSLLDFARHREFRRERVQLQPLVEQTLGFIRGDVPPGVMVESTIATGLAVAGDPQRLQQALLNLVKNAVEALDGVGRVTISASPARIAAGAEREPPFSGCALDGEVIDIAVADTGSGITADVLPQIFDPFYTTKDVGKGMGLGLFITHEVVEEHDGCIAVTTGGTGTTFHIRLPSAVTLPPADATVDMP